MTLRLTMTVDPSIMRALGRAQPAALRTFLRKSTRTRGKPSLDAIQAKQPVRRGLLRAAYGMAAYGPDQEGGIGVTIQPRSTFGFTDTDGTKRLVTQKSRAHKRVKAAIAAGKAIDDSNPWEYAFGVETGRKPKGALARAAGGVNAIPNAITTEGQRFLTGVATDVFQFISTGAG